jgi:phospholipid/cholesterol/gamma-HCH transport system substrate-binding protein
MSTNKGQTAETLLGAVVIAVAIGFLGFAVTRAGTAGSGRGYELWALFDNATGISVGADVRTAGVKVGAVSKVVIDPQTYYARVTMTIDPAVKLPDDSSAKVSQDGLLGGAHISLAPGGSETMLASGGEILNTQGSIDIVSTMIAAFGSGAQKEDPAP